MKQKICLAQSFLRVLLVALVWGMACLPANALVGTAVSVTKNNIKYTIYTGDHTAKVTGLGGTFNSSSVAVPSTITQNSVNYTVTHIGPNAFSSAASLLTGEISIPSSVTDIDNNAFASLSSVTRLVWEANITINSNYVKPLTRLQELVTSASVGASAFSNRALKTVRLRGTAPIAIYANAFYNCNLMTSVVADNAGVKPNVSTIGNSAFQACNKLSDASGLYTGTYTTIGEYAFSACALTTFSFPASLQVLDNRCFESSGIATVNLLSTSLYQIGYKAFSNCKKLTSVKLPSRTVTLGDNVFENCSSLYDINLNSITTSIIPSSAFAGCSSLKSVSLPSSITTIKGYAFDGAGLTSISLPAKLESIGSSAFRACKALTSLSGSPTALESIGLSAFSRCSSLTSASALANSRLRTIGASAFEWCPLTSLTLPATLTSIESAAFSNCDALASVKCNAESAPTIGANAFLSALPRAERTLEIGYSTTSSYSKAGWNQYFTFTYPAATSAKVNPTSMTLYRGQRSQLVVESITPSNADPRVKFSSGNPALVSVDEDGWVSALRSTAGAVTVYVEDYATGKKVLASCSVTVKDITSITLSQTSATIYRGKSLKLYVASVNPSQGSKEVSWSSDNTSVATVAADGTVKALSVGTCKIKATSPNNRTAECTITVADATSISLSETSLKLLKPGGAYLTAQLLPAEASQEVTWTSSSPSVATVDESGHVVSVSEGVTVVTATSPNGLVAHCDVTVTEAKVLLSANSLLIKAGQARKLEATIDGGVTWSSDKPDVVSVDKDGNIQALKDGCAVITAQSKKFDYAEGKCQVVVSDEDRLMYVGGIYYLPIDDRDNEVRVTNLALGNYEFYQDDLDRSEYSATINVPSEIKYDGTTYRVTEIGDYAFFRMENLQQVYVPASVDRIGHHAFFGCPQLRRVYFDKAPALTTIDYSAFANCDLLNNVTLPNTVTTVGPAAFMDCPELSKITLSTGMTQLSDNIFRNCDKLQTIVIPDAVHTIGKHAFQDCEILSDITYSTALTLIDEYAFAETPALTDVVLPQGVVTIQDYAYYKSELQTIQLPATLLGLGANSFRDCESLTSISFQNKQPISIGYSAFSGCDGLESVDIVDLAAWVQSHFANLAANPTSMSRTLSLKGSQLFDIVVPDKATYINQYAFGGLAYISTITLPASIKYVSDDIFLGCSSLVDLIVQAPVPPLFVGSRPHKRMAGYYYDVQLQVPGGSEAEYQSSDFWKYFFKASPIPFSDPFIEMERQSLLLTLGEREQIGYNYDDDVNWESSNTSVATVSSEGEIVAVGTGTTIVTVSDASDAEIKGQVVVRVSEEEPMYIGSFYFTPGEKGCATLTNHGEGLSGNYLGVDKRYEYTGIVEVPASFTYGGESYVVTQVGDYAFYHMPHLQVAILPSGINKVGNSAFEYADHMERIQFHAATKLTSMGERAFFRCEELDKVSLPNTFQTLPREAFRFCLELKDISLPNCLTMIDEYAFSSCEQLAAITLPETLDNIQGYAFSESDLRQITIPSLVRGIGNFCFRNCMQLEKINFQNVNDMTVGESAFQSCTALTEVKVDHMAAWVKTNFNNAQANPTYYAKSISGEGVKGSHVAVPDAYPLYINQYAFVNCENLTSVVLPESTTSVSDNIFLGCTNLTSVACNATSAPVYLGTQKSVLDMMDVFKKATLLVPNEGYSEYVEDDTYWANFSEISSHSPGDINHDGKLTAQDVQLLTDMLLGKTAATGNADVNADGQVDLEDLTELINLIAK